MFDEINRYITGKECPHCHCEKLYNLSDGRFMCSFCRNKYNAKKLVDEMTILHYFSLEIPANKAAKDLQFSYYKIKSRYQAFREEIVDFLSQESNKLTGEIECDESYFGGKRKGNRGRGSSGKVKVFGMLERHGRIFTTVVDDVSAETLMNEIKAHATKGSVFYTDQFKSYKSLKHYGKHMTINHNNQFSEGRRHINGLEGFWSFAKERFLKYHGVSKHHFFNYLKEMEFRYNYRKQNLYHLLIKIHFGPKIN